MFVLQTAYLLSDLELVVFDIYKLVLTWIEVVDSRRKEHTPVFVELIFVLPILINQSFQVLFEGVQVGVSLDAEVLYLISMKFVVISLQLTTDLLLINHLSCCSLHVFESSKSLLRG